MFESQQNVIRHQVGDVRYQFILILPKQWKFIVSSSVAFHCNHKNTDKGS